MATESDIQTKVIQYLRGRGCYVLNVGGSASTPKGTPDLIVCYRGLFLGLELKKPDGTYGATKPQEIRMKQIRSAGGQSILVTGIEDVRDMLVDIDLHFTLEIE